MTVSRYQYINSRSGSVFGRYAMCYLNETKPARVEPSCPGLPDCLLIPLFQQEPTRLGTRESYTFALSPYALVPNW